MKFVRTMMAVAVAGMAGLAVPDAATAQQPVVPEEQETIEVTDELLERFVAVYPVVVGVAQAAQTELATAETPEDAQAIQAEAQERVAELLDEGDLTAPEYEAVVSTLNSDPEMLAKFEEMLEEQEDGSGL
ncbi:MAG TPA: DUF4168 domain-containing protein [Gemmatimonadota bacterium]|nr:DUF4168 domain-containing protein [Gemmatimonadota bacterium]